IRRQVTLELKELIFLAVPITLTNLLLNLMAIIDQILVGHLGPTELAVAALSNMTFNLVYLPLIGFLTVLKHFSTINIHSVFFPYSLFISRSNFQAHITLVS